MKLLQPIEFESVSVADARRELVGFPPPAADSIDWTGRRIARSAEALRPATVQWMQSLPVEIQPVELAQKYARIANKLSELWNAVDPTHCASYLSELMIVRRGARKGFPPDVAMEIGALNVYYATMHPPSRPWN